MSMKDDQRSLVMMVDNKVEVMDINRHFVTNLLSSNHEKDNDALSER